MPFEKDDRERDFRAARAAEVEEKVGRPLPGVRHANRRSLWADHGKREHGSLAIQCQGLGNGLTSWNYCFKFSTLLSQAENFIDYKKKKQKNTVTVIVPRGIRPL